MPHRRYCKYRITLLEKNWKPQLYVEPDVGIPLDLLDLSVYNPPKGERIHLIQRTRSCWSMMIL